MKRSVVLRSVALLFVALLSLAAAIDLSSVIRQVNDHKEDAERIINQVTKGPAKGQTYSRLALFADTFGSRISGSDALERSIDYVLAQLQAEGFDNVHGEEVTVPYWVRGNEQVKMLQPIVKPIGMLGLGNSVGTTGITAEAIVVSSFDELQKLAARNETFGKIVVYNQYCNWTAEPVSCYGKTSGYRGRGAIEAAKVGAVASLTRSIASFSLYSPHTGVMNYQDGVPKIPAACITIEDAEMMARMQSRGQKIILSIQMDAKSMPSRTSRNVVADWKGTTHPDEIVVISGHIDSWDVGQGAMDDGGGIFVSWQALSLLKQLGLRPKRTIRLIMWTCEEFGGIGAQQYFDRHKHNVNLYDLVMETDLGNFRPLGIEFTGSDEAMAIMKSIGPLLASINATVVTTGGGGTDISPWMNAGVPGASLANDNKKYFWYHHTNADMMTAMDSNNLDLCAATWAVTAFVVADLDVMLPRKK